MSKPDFMSLTRAQFRQYILEHREDEEALHIYIDRFQSPNNKVFPAPQTIEDLENFPQLHQQHLEERYNQA
ncbi:hypothetical protein I8752_14280 [Nostocaceae cyanobacterium CENA369]|uniref:Uncharacterized protein n=1 Tax=Dendronalium phyllosphericum CENA369 TaxID=1725256 RepID=A0A8J7LHM0_9NOST|nr:hypothetical protein [Dendronalium phyllosphericum]MBH8574164.1 hypothetical protein [Dendronalium phyllosphericum CENA369]